MLTALVTVIALASAWHSAGRMWRHLNEQHRVYSGYTETQRRHATIESLGVGASIADIFDFYKQYIDPRDRVYLQVRESGFSSFVNYQTAFAYAARYYFLPALPAVDLKDATVVVTFFADPKELHTRFITQQQAGLQPIFVSRIKTP